MHSSLVVSNGVPLGLSAVKFWTRKKFNGTNALKKRINATRMPIEEKESYRWIENVRQATELLGEAQRCVHIADREGDIYELFSSAMEIGTHFLIRICVDRLAGEDGETIAKIMEKVETAGLHCVKAKDKDGNDYEAMLRVRYCRMTLHPPVGKQSRYPSLEVTVIYADEENPPAGRERLEWKLVTDLPVNSFLDAVEKLDWYTQRWKIEIFHKILKSGCKAEESKLRTAERLICLLSVFCVVSWRIFWLCMVNRADPAAPAGMIFCDTEIRLLKHLRPAAMRGKDKPTVSDCLNAVARLGGYLSRRGDTPPGNMVLWRGFKRLIDLHLGFTLGSSDPPGEPMKNCG
jgi:hypothetical protein